MTSRELLENIRNAAIDASFRTYHSPGINLRSWLGWIYGLLFQVQGREHLFHRFQYSAQQLYFLLALSQTGLTLVSLSQDYHGLALIALLGTLLYSGSMILNKHAHDHAALWLTVIGINLLSAIYTLGLGWKSGFYFQLLIIGPLLFLHPGGKIRLKLVLTLFSALHMAILNLLIINSYRWELLSIEWMTLLHYGNVIATYVMLSWFTFVYHWVAKQSEAQLRAISEQWQRLASRDALTGLYNRRAINDLLEEEVSRVQRGSRPFTLALVDIDHFKNINDNFGHQSGDEVIRAIAQRMGSFFRHHDIVARWGGEEFLILFPELSAQQAAGALDKLRKQIAASGIHSGGNEIAVTITIGIAEHTTQQQLQQTIQYADEALYHGKKSGRNQIIIHES